MAHGQNAIGCKLGNKSFQSRRPLHCYPTNKVNKELCHRIERSVYRREIEIELAGNPSWQEIDEDVEGLQAYRHEDV